MHRDFSRWARERGKFFSLPFSLLSFQETRVRVLRVVLPNELVIKVQEFARGSRFSSRRKKEMRTPAFNYSFHVNVNWLLSIKCNIAAMFASGQPLDRIFFFLLLQVSPSHSVCTYANFNYRRPHQRPIEPIINYPRVLGCNFPSSWTHISAHGLIVPRSQVCNETRHKYSNYIYVRMYVRMNV